MRRLHRIGMLISAILLCVGSVLVIGVPGASAAVSGNEFCFENNGYACLNAWGGGPWVDVYTAGPTGTANNYFTAIYHQNTGDWQIVDTDGGTWKNDCIGDAYNESGQAETSLDSCGTNGVGGGWGTNFEEDPGACSNGGVAFLNVHWNGYLGPPNKWVNGSNFYLNKSVDAPICFVVYT
jgi:hypothetical protein